MVFLSQAITPAAVPGFIRAMLSTEDRYRKLCNDLKNLGVKQRFLADLIGRSDTWVSDWLTEKNGELRTKQTDALDKYFGQLAALLARRPNISHGKEPPRLEQPAVKARNTRSA